MVGIDCYIFGYRKIKIPPEKLSEATSVLLRGSIPSRINSDGTFMIRERDFNKMSALFNGRIEFLHSKPLGLYGKYKLLKHKAIYISAIIISFTFIFVLSNFVWDIRIEGNEQITTAQIKNELSECGLSVGDFWPLIKRGIVESKFAEKEDRISWININRRGSVAYVKVIEREDNNKEEEAEGKYSNLVSAYDCVIEEITVNCGMAVVKPGDVVKKGDILIIGVMPQESGGGFCSAEGRVVGRINESITAQVNRKYDKTTYNDNKIYSVDINFLNFSINIFKLYGNLTGMCDIIETEKTYSLFWGRRLPFSISIKYISEVEKQESIYSDEELVKIASSRLDALTASRLYLSDLLKVKSFGEFTEDGYLIGSDIVYLSEVSERSEFKVD
jgi:sporulation protein YqfD